jgi:hypothetical protein
MNDIERLAAITDDEIRKQAKFDHIIAVMQGEGGNFSAGIYISLLSAFAVAMSGQGYDPMGVLLNINKAARDDTRALLRNEGISTSKKLDG